MKKEADNEIKSDFKDQKKKIVDQIDKEISGYVKTKQDRENIMEFSLNISDVAQLQKIIRNLKKIDSVFEVKRLK